MSESTPIVVFDGACGFCTWCVEVARDRMRAAADYRPYQRTDLAELGVDLEQAEQAVLFVAGGQVRSGARAVAAILMLGRRPWPWVGALIDAPVVEPLAERSYRFVARHRGRIPGVRPALSVRRPEE